MPGLSLAVAVTEAMPPTIVAWLSESVAEGAEDGAGAVKKIVPPLTGSMGLLAVTVTVSGLANGWPTGVVCPLPPEMVRWNPWLSKAPMSGGRRVESRAGRCTG